ncbi:extracellular solute-binding protein [Selenomonas sp. TAMA-11512]|uniref:ABC transporter substrate-binding protein n=1 Tax=Selenomonas sp. TAMA-11512 TaxID=3095337 RepID=UPI003089C027|nr:extracellular solute-binding protein [Selenomonas sp. TAMA-11512]
MRRENIYRRLISAAVCLLLVLLAGYCAHALTRPTELRVAVFAGSHWEVPENAPYHVLDAAIERFRASHPDVEVTYASGIRKEDYREFVAGELVKGRAPDVFLVLREDFDRYAEMGVLEPLDAYIKEDAELDAALYYPALLAAGQVGGRQYALPLECSPQMMFVNTSLLAEEGIPLPKSDWTWQELLSVTSRVTRDTDGDGRIDRFGIYDYGWMDAARTNGVNLSEREAWLHAFDEVPMQEAILFAANLTREGEMQRARSVDFDAGRVAFRPFTFAAYRAYKPYPWSVKKYTTFSWEILPMPRGGRGENRSSVDVLLVGMSAESAHKELAYAFLKELAYSREGQREILVYAMGLPTRRDIIRSETMNEVLYTESGERRLSSESVHEVLERAVHLPHFARAEEAERLATKTIQPLLSDPQDVSEILIRLGRKVRILLEI